MNEPGTEGTDRGPGAEHRPLSDRRELGGLRKQAECVFIAVALVSLLFADVIFRGGSLSPLDYEPVLATGDPLPAPVSLLPERAGRQITDGWGDTGSALFQMQPAQKFMAHVLRSGESPYWDPYAATGTMGPETLVDVKFSAITLVGALLGANSAQFTFILLALYICALYAILRIATAYLHLSVPAGLAACAVFMLNGFALMNLNTAIGQPYFLAPIVLLSLLAISRRVTTARIVLSVLAHALLFSVTLLPTMALALIAVHGIALADALSRNRSRRSRFVILAYHVAIPIAALCLLAFLYLPIFEAYLRYVDTWSAYSRRAIAPIARANLLSIFTPKHFWQSYRAMQIDPTWPTLHYERWVPHLGVIACLVAAHAIQKGKQSFALAVTCLGFVLIAQGKAFGIFPLTYLSSLPFFSFIRNEYWPAITCLGLTILVGLGFDALHRQNAFNPVVVVLVGIMLGAFLFLARKIGLPEHGLARPYIAAFLLILLTSLACFGLLRVTRYGRAVRLLLLLGMFVEGLFYMNTLHPLRSDRDKRLPESLAWVKARLSRPDGDRALNIGTTGVFPNWGSALQIPELGALTSAESPKYREFFHRHIGTGIFLSLYDSDSRLAFDDESLSLLGVRYVITDRAMSNAISRLESFGYVKVQQDRVRLIFENPHPLPRAFAVSALLHSDRLPSEISVSPLQAATTVDPQLQFRAQQVGVKTEPPPKSERDADLLGNSEVGNVSLVAYHHSLVKLHASLRTPAVVVLMDSWHPSWQAKANGKEAYVGYVNMAFRGIALPAGDHQIELFYEPKTLRIGELLSAVTLATLLALLFVRRECPLL